MMDLFNGNKLGHDDAIAERDEWKHDFVSKINKIIT
jgi:hypothetical protein